jgi:nucleotide-binding universal stress UspA family protein
VRKPASIRRLLCATDLSSASEYAWEQAQRLGALFEAEVVLAHVVPSVVVPAEPSAAPLLVRDVLEMAHRQPHDALERLVGGLVGSGLKVSVRVEQGSPARRILDIAREDAIDLVVVGTHGRTGLGGAVFGSVADRVVRLAPCAVMTVPAARAEALPAHEWISRICYATDFSPEASAAWQWALALASVTDAEVDLLHVTPLPVIDGERSAETLGQMAKMLHEEGQARAERFLRDCPLPADRVHVLIGRGVVSEQLLHSARARAVDLIVMGTHGWSGPLRWMLGSVAHHVIQAAPCPVLTVGPTSRTEELSDVG